jgi:hypothetical protein
VFVCLCVGWLGGENLRTRVTVLVMVGSIYFCRGMRIGVNTQPHIITTQRTKSVGRRPKSNSKLDPQNLYFASRNYKMRTPPQEARISLAVARKVQQASRTSNVASDASGVRSCVCDTGTTTDMTQRTECHVRSRLF